MNLIKVKKDELLAILKANRATHRKIFEEAQVGYKNKAIELLEASLERARKGKQIRMAFSLQEPVDQTKDYDRAIKMLEMAVDKVIELDEVSFAHFVMDDWTWKRQFLASNSAYSVTASTLLDQSR